MGVHEQMRDEFDQQAEERGLVRTFDTGATRDLDDTKHDPEGFWSPQVVEAYNAYMNFNRHTAAGTRDSDNWQKGIPATAYMKSGWRHFLDWWKGHRGLPTREGMVWALTGLMFNVMGYLHELLVAEPKALDAAVKAAEARRKAAQSVPPGVLREPVGFVPRQRDQHDAVAAEAICAQIGC